MKIVLVGASHQSAPLELRERLAVEDTKPPLQDLVAGDEIDEAVLLSTCNRVELVALTRTPESARDRLHSFFSRDLGGAEGVADEPDLEGHLYEHSGSDAVGHVMRVASALDSMVVGEPQILGQTKEAYRTAVECEACGPILSRLFQSAFAAAKRVRSETRVGERPVSVARVAVELAENIFEDFANKRALLIGAGEMIEMALRTLRSKGLESIAVANRTPERAALLAVEFGATAHGLDELTDLLYGFHTGAIVAFEFARLFPERCAGAVVNGLVCMEGDELDDLLETLQRAARNHRRRRAPAVALGATAGSDAVLSVVPQDARRAHGAGSARRRIPASVSRRLPAGEAGRAPRLPGRVQLSDPRARARASRRRST